MTTFSCDGGRSGIGQYAINLLREFRLPGVESSLELLAYEDEKGVFRTEKGQFHEHQFGAALHNPLLGLAWYQLALPRWCRKQKLDVLFLPDGNRRLPLRVSCPTVGTVHDISSIHMERKYDPVRECYFKRVLPFLVRRLDHIISVSEATKLDLVNFAGVPPERVTVIPHGVDGTTFHPCSKEQAFSRLAARYPIQHPYILYVSRIEHPGKNHVRLIKAFARLRTQMGSGHQLVFAGADWSRADEVRRAARDCGFADNIVFTGFVPAADLPDLYCGADVFVFPSLWEGFGMPILEAMASGTPVACSNLSSMPEVAGDAAMMFDPYDEEALTAALHKLTTDNGSRSHFIEKGLERGRCFNWKETAARTMRVIEEAAHIGAISRTGKGVRECA